jgi:uncharacterized RDD family membrane protein YckC
MIAAPTATPVAPSPVSSSPNLSPLYSGAAVSSPAVAATTSARYGGFWIRVVAAIIDAILLRVVVSPIRIIFGGIGWAGMRSGVPHVPLAIFGGGLTLIVLVFASWLYEALMESSSYQATLGKMIFGMKVTDLNGSRISFERATGRHFAKWLSAMILCIGYIMVGITERKQGLHDLLAGTLVRRT